MRPQPVAQCEPPPEACRHACLAWITHTQTGCGGAVLSERRTLAKPQVLAPYGEPRISGRARPGRSAARGWATGALGGEPPTPGALGAQPVRPVRPARLGIRPVR